MRCFIAINLGDSLKEKIGSLITELYLGNWDVKWIPAENLHITLKFLGEISAEPAEKINAILSDVSGRYCPFEVGFHGVGVFPDRRRPRVIWIDLRYPKELINMKKEVDHNLINLGFKSETTKFLPHLTIGRVRSFQGRDSLLSALEELRERDFGKIEVNKIALMKSDLKPSGAQYSVMTEFPLTRRNDDE